MLSIICPTYNEEKYIEACIKSVLAQDYPKEDLEVIFADGMSQDKTREIISKYSAKYPFIRLIDNPDRIVPPALNRSIEASNGDIIMRIDAHAEYSSNYFSVLANIVKKFDVENVGAVCKTDVFNKNPKSLAIKEVLSHPLGVGNSSFRTGIDKMQEVDTVPFGCWKREVFEKYGYFDTRLIRNQDIEFNKRIIRGGGKILIVPETYSVYYARENYKKLAKNNYGNGKWNILTVWFTKQFNSLSPRHFIPLVFLLALLLPIIGSIFWFPLIWISWATLALYLFVVSLISIIIKKKKKLKIRYLIPTFFILHLSYGWGSLVGLLQLPFKKR